MKLEDLVIDSTIETIRVFFDFFTWLFDVFFVLFYGVFDGCFMLFSGLFDKLFEITEIYEYF